MIGQVSGKVTGQVNGSVAGQVTGSVGRDPAARTELAERRGLCGTHASQFEKVAAPREVCAAFAEPDADAPAAGPIARAKASSGTAPMATFDVPRGLVQESFFSKNFIMPSL